MRNETATTALATSHDLELLVAAEIERLRPQIKVRSVMLLPAGEQRTPPLLLSAPEGPTHPYEIVIQLTPAAPVPEPQPEAMALRRPMWWRLFHRLRFWSWRRTNTSAALPGVARDARGLTDAIDALKSPSFRQGICAGLRTFSGDLHDLNNQLLKLLLPISATTTLSSALSGGAIVSFGGFSLSAVAVAIIVIMLGRAGVAAFCAAQGIRALPSGTPDAAEGGVGPTAAAQPTA